METYSFVYENIAPLDFAKTLFVEVYDGANLISGTADYSVTRAVARKDVLSVYGEKSVVNTLYSLGKAATWAAYFQNAGYTYVPDYGRPATYTAVIGEYTYNDARMSAGQTMFSSLPQRRAARSRSKFRVRVSRAAHPKSFRTA